MKLGDDGNQMQADGNSIPVFILGWTFGAKGGFGGLVAGQFLYSCFFRRINFPSQVELFL